jgi:hypothetical protein
MKIAPSIFQDERRMIKMVPLLIGGAAAVGIWAHNIAKIVQLSNRNRNYPQRRDSERRDLNPSSGEKHLTIFNNCTFEDKRTFNFNHYDRCVINTYNIYLTRGGRDERHSKGKGRRESAWLPEMDE